MKDEYDEVKVVRLGERAKKTMQDYCLKPFGSPPERNRPHRVGVSRCNRRGAPLNMNIVVNVIARSFIKDQYDPSLAKVGVALRYKDPTKRMEEIETNKYYATLNSNHPPIHENDMDTFAVASTHHNLTLRMWEAGMQIDGQTLECKDDADLEDRVT